MSKLCNGQTLKLQIQGWFIANPFNDSNFSLMTSREVTYAKIQKVVYVYCLHTYEYLHIWLCNSTLFIIHTIYKNGPLYSLLAQIQLFAFAYFVFWSADFCLMRKQKSAQKIMCAYNWICGYYYVL